MDILNPRYSIYLLSVLLLAIVVLFNTALQNENSPKLVEYRGLYIQGFENSSFVPCGASERWWVERLGAESGEDLSLRYNSLVTENEQPIYLVVVGVLSEKGRHGHLGGWDRALSYRKITEATTRLPADCLLGRS